MADTMSGKTNYGLSLILCWTFLIAAILVATLAFENRTMLKTAESEARDYFRLNLMYRRWGSNLGGVYAPIEKVAPNRYLNVPDRDVITSSGKRLTLVNPAYMTAMVFQEAGKESTTPIISKITSLNPLNPENSPDNWERMALKAFEQHERIELSQVLQINGRSYLRFMSGFKTEKTCLKCHEHQGYREGDIRGGISISVPMEGYYASQRMTRAAITAGYMVLWALGSGGIILSTRRGRHYERQLVASEEKFRTVCDWNYDWEYWAAPSGEIVYISPSVERITGYPAESFLSDPTLVSRLVHPADSDAFNEHLCQEPGAGVEARQAEFRIITRDGDTRWIHHMCREIVINDVNRGHRVSNRDITERKRDEEALNRSEAFNKSLNRISQAFLANVSEDKLFEEVLNIILDIVHSPHGVIGYIDEAGSLVCPSMTRSVWSECRMSNKTTSFGPETWGATMWGNCLQDGLQRFRNEPFSVPEGHVPIGCCASVPLVEHGRTVGLILVANRFGGYGPQEMDALGCIAEYMTPIVSARVQQQQATRALWESLERYALLYSAMSQGMALFEVICDESGLPVDYRHLEVNPAYETMLNIPREQIVGRRLCELLPQLEPFWLNALASVALSGKSEAFENRVASLGRDYQVFAYSPQVGQVAVLANDITEMKRQAEERKNLEEQMMHAQKLESLGVLAGGIAHDFNNILTTVIGNAELALMRVGPESPVVENLLKIEKASMRATDLAKQMLAYSGKGRFIVEPFDLNRLIGEMVHLLEVAISKKVVLRFNLQESLPALEGDATQLQQVIMNIVINASEAIGDTNGVIAIRTGCMECDRKYLGGAWIEDNLQEGLYLFLEISDTGSGMDRETLGRIFDPFFTTKFTGRGLGMAAVLGIVRGHKGAIKAYSEPGRGTTFKLLFPASKLTATLPNGEAGPREWHGEGFILLVDDEESVCAIGAEMLGEIGFDVVTAHDGMEALERYRERRDYRCVILDLTMPHMDGEQAFRELRMMDPDVKVIMSSGYNELEINEKFAGKGHAGFIQKPYKFSDLRDVLQQVLS